MTTPVEEVRQILAGIDEQETQRDDGWWETSTGAEFGAQKLAEVVALIDRLQREQSLASEVLADAAAQDAELKLLRGLLKDARDGLVPYMAKLVGGQGQPIPNHAAQVVARIDAHLEGANG